MRRVCDACGVELHPSLARCPLCGGENPGFDAAAAPAFPAEGPRPDPPRLRKAEALILGAFAWISAFLAAINALDYRGLPWALYPIGAMAGLAVLARGRRSLPSPKGGYLVLLVEGTAAGYLGLIAALAPAGAWYIEYFLPSLALAGGAALGLLALVERRPLKKSYAPLLVQSAFGALCYPLALLTTDREGAIYGGIVAFFGAAGLFLIAKSARRWWRSEARRKLTIR